MRDNEEKSATEFLLDYFKAYNQAGVLMQMDNVSNTCKMELTAERDSLRAQAVDYFNDNFAKIARKA